MTKDVEIIVLYLLALFATINSILGPTYHKLLQSVLNLLCKGMKMSPSYSNNHSTCQPRI